MQKIDKMLFLLSCFHPFACPVEFLPREILKGHFTGGEARLTKGDYSTGVLS
jgi:hypothetical protein